jgi:hypothetical protein
MQGFEYKVVPAPRRGEKARGLKTTEARYAFALTRMMNEMAAEGWEYLRADTLPVEERVGLTGRATTFQHMLVFRRALAAQGLAAPAAPRHAPAPIFAEDADGMADIDPMDVAARRAALIARPQFGTAPRVNARAETGLAPQVGPARGGEAAE